mgnify:CR=1 FL=1
MTIEDLTGKYKIMEIIKLEMIYNEFPYRLKMSIITGDIKSIYKNLKVHKRK